MQINDLVSKWEMITEEPNLKGYLSIRVSSVCLPELYIGKNNNGNRCLILILGNDYVVDYQSCYKEKLSIEYSDTANLIILQLKDNDFIDLFNDLILFIFNHISEVENIKIYPKEIFKTFHRWSDFFEDKESGFLPQNVIKGIWGELFTLKNNLENCTSLLLMNEILSSWRGPYDEDHDFVQDIADVEVKTKEFTKQTIHISSEYQLKETKGKGLELRVISVKSDICNGESIGELVRDMKELAHRSSSDFSILLRALAQKNISLQNIEQYDSFKYIPVNVTTYNCCKENFPRLIPDTLDSAQQNVKYELILSELKEFIIDKIEFN